jgi:hypothetical protein
MPWTAYTVLMKISPQDGAWNWYIWYNLGYHDFTVALSILMLLRTQRYKMTEELHIKKHDYI